MGMVTTLTAMMLMGTTLTRMDTMRMDMVMSTL